MNPHQIELSEAEIKAEQASFFTKVYGWMGLALALTGATAWYVASNPSLVAAILMNKSVFYGLMIGELLMVVALAGLINRISSVVAFVIFLVYSVLNGLTFSVIFMAFTMESIASTFFITAGTFVAMSAVGFFTKRDLTGIGQFAIMALIGLIIASVVNIFWSNETFYWITSYAGVIIFVLLTAYDTQKLKKVSLSGLVDEETGRKQAIFGALSLYLDFVNLFLYLLRFMGNRK